MAEPATIEPADAATTTRGPGPGRALLAFLGNPKVAMVLMGLGILLVLAGTLAQVSLDLNTVQRTYFRSWFVHVDAWHVTLPGGFTLGLLMVASLTAATLRRPLRLHPRSLGVLIMHASVALFLVGELATAVMARETNMEITEGQTVSHSFSTQEVELAVVDVSDAERDMVVSVPQRLLATDATFQHALLPFEVAMKQWLPRSRLERPTASAPAVASAGAGREWVALPEDAPPPGQRSFPSAYVTLQHEGDALGTYLVSPLFTQPQRVMVAGRPYELSLRFRRFPEGFSLHLLDFAHDRYQGTSVAKNFSSRVRLVDAELNEDREVVISMNQPLRHRGLAIYQSAYKDNDRTTVLQVVKNPGWTIPYGALALAALGMSLYFGEALVRSSRRATP